MRAWTLLDFAAADPPLDPDRHREHLAESEREGTDEAEERPERLVSKRNVVAQ